jgi:hypothetical protein
LHEAAPNFEDFLNIQSEIKKSKTLMWVQSGRTVPLSFCREFSSDKCGEGGENSRDPSV